STNRCGALHPRSASSAPSWPRGTFRKRSSTTTCTSATCTRRTTGCSSSIGATPLSRTRSSRSTSRFTSSSTSTTSRRAIRHSSDSATPISSLGAPASSTRSSSPSASPRSRGHSDGCAYTTRSPRGNSATSSSSGSRRSSAAPSLTLAERVLVHEHAPRLRAFVAADDSAPLEHVDEAAGPRIADAQAALEKRDGRSLRLNNDLDRSVEQRVVVGIEVSVRAVVLGIGEDLGQLEIALVQLLLPLARLLDDERDLLLGDVRALDALQARGAERLEQHVALAE